LAVEEIEDPGRCSERAAMLRPCPTAPHGRDSAQLICPNGGGEGLGWGPAVEGIGRAAEEEMVSGWRHPQGRAPCGQPWAAGLPCIPAVVALGMRRSPNSTMPRRSGGGEHGAQLGREAERGFAVSHRRRTLRRGEAPKSGSEWRSKEAALLQIMCSALMS